MKLERRNRKLTIIFDDILLKKLPEYLYSLKNKNNVKNSCLKFQKQLKELEKFCTVLYYTDYDKYTKLKNCILIIDELAIKLKIDNGDMKTFSSLEKQIQIIYDTLDY